MSIASCLLAPALILGACGKNSKNPSDDKPTDGAGDPEVGKPAGVTPGDGQKVQMAGQLLITRLELLAGEPDSILAVAFVGGKFNLSKDRLIKVKPDAMGNFSVDLAVQDVAYAKFQAVIRPDGTVDREALKKFGQDPGNYSDEQVKAFIKAMKPSPVTWLVVAYRSSPTGDWVAEAKTFRFIGLKAGDRNLFGLPIAKVNHRLHSVVFEPIYQR